MLKIILNHMFFGVIACISFIVFIIMRTIKGVREMKSKVLGVLIICLMVAGCGNRGVIETKAYIKQLGDKAADMSIGGDADAYITLEWGKNQTNITKHKLEKYYKSLKQKRINAKNLRVTACTGISTEGWEYHCFGYWYTFTSNGKIYNCLPQSDGGELYKDDICSEEERYACHVNSDNITDEKIVESCKWNKEVMEWMNEAETQTQKCFADGMGMECLFKYGGIPKRMEKQE